MHGQADDHEKGKSEIIMYYNKTKWGVDTFDQICSNNSCSRMNKRWIKEKKHKRVGGSWKNSHLRWYGYVQRGGLLSQNFHWASEKLWKWRFHNSRSFQYHQDPNNCQSTRGAGFALTAKTGRPKKSALTAILQVRQVASFYSQNGICVVLFMLIANNRVWLVKKTYKRCCDFLQSENIF